MNRKKTEEKTKQTFNPQTSYEWDPEDVFQLTGLEIDRINKALAAASAAPDFQRHAVIYEGLLAFNNFFRSAVEEGAIKAKTQDSTEKGPAQLSVAEDLAPTEEAVAVEA